MQKQISKPKLPAIAIDNGSAQCLIRQMGLEDDKQLFNDFTVRHVFSKLPLYGTYEFIERGEAFEERR